MKLKQNSFNQECYKLLLRIPQGKVTTYKEIAEALNTKAYRAVGNAMAKNRNLELFPCYKVVKSNGEVGNYRLGVEKKINMLKADGINITNGKVQQLGSVLYKFNQNKLPPV